jgi:hypothetical protein
MTSYVLCDSIAGVASPDVSNNYGLPVGSTGVNIQVGTFLPSQVSLQVIMNGDNPSGLSCVYYLIASNDNLHWNLVPFAHGVINSGDPNNNNLIFNFGEIMGQYISAFFGSLDGGGGNVRGRIIASFNPYNG